MRGFWLVAAVGVMHVCAEVMHSDGSWGPLSETTTGVLGIPAVLHRSHKYSRAMLESSDCDGACARTLRNLRSCAAANARHETRYYDDTELDAEIDAAVAALRDAGHAQLAAATQRAVASLRSAPLASIFVLRADVARYALLWHRGGFWVDADVHCEGSSDEITQVLGPLMKEACVLAWEGDVAAQTSAPLNWAFGNCLPYS